MKSLTDEQLVDLYRKGEVSAFEELYVRYNKVVRSFVRSYYLVGGDEDDLYQEAMLGFLSAVRTFESEKSKFSTFAITCIKNNVYNAINRSKADKHKALNSSVSILEVDGELERSKNLLPEDIVIGNESFSETVDGIRSVLSTCEKKVFDLYTEGLNYREIAGSLGVTPKRVDNALQRIKAKIKKFRR